MSKSSRQLAYEALMRVEREQAYSNITLNLIFSEENADMRDKAFASVLFYGVIEKKLLLDYNLSQFSDKPINKLDTEMLVILRMGLYQLFFMNSVPAAAAVNESVKLCKDNNLYSASGYANGVLRRASKADSLTFPNKRKGKNKYLSIKYSCPEKIIRLWRESYGDDIVQGILTSLEGRPPIAARVNTLKTDTDSLVLSLHEENIGAESSELLDGCIFLHETGSVENIMQYSEGLFHVQDTASQLCCRLLEAKPGNTVIDSCSAPGGKAFTIAQYMKNSGKIISCDMYKSRLTLVRQGAERLGVDIIETVAADSSEYKAFPQADRVLCDVPCSGLGVIRRKPELRYKENLGLDTLPDLQYLILCNCAAFAKSGGIVIYSTCTLNPSENGMNIRRFLSEHPEFEPYRLKLPMGIRRGIDEPENELTLFPHINGTDGFFISAVKRK